MDLGGAMWSWMHGLIIRAHCICTAMSHNESKEKVTVVVLLRK